MTIYRALGDVLRPKSTEVGATKGQLLFPWKPSHPNDLGGIPLTVSPNGWGMMVVAKPGDVEAVTQPKASEFELLLQHYGEGLAPLPNAKMHEPATFCADLDRIAYAGGPGRLIGRRAQMPGFEPEFATIWANVTQGGRYDGTGFLIFYLAPWSRAARQGLQRFASFKICDHAVVKGASANPSRGWHPAQCSKCGLDMTVDSSD